MALRQAGLSAWGKVRGPSLEGEAVADRDGEEVAVRRRQTGLFARALDEIARFWASATDSNAAANRSPVRTKAGPPTTKNP